MPQEAKDLVERLLKLHPPERLGAGKPGEPNDMTILVKHPYFEGIDFVNLMYKNVPLELPKKMQ